LDDIVFESNTIKKGHKDNNSDKFLQGSQEYFTAIILGSIPMLSCLVMGINGGCAGADGKACSD
jgi:hypothetical protein